MKILFLFFVLLDFSKLVFAQIPLTTLARQNSTATKNLNQPNGQNTDTIIPYIDVNSQNKIVNPRYKTYEQMNLESTSPTPAPNQ